MEDRNHQNNIPFDGFLEQDGVESWEESEDKLKKFIAEYLAIEEQVITERVQKIGKAWKYSEQYKNTAIVARFLILNRNSLY